MSSDLAVFPDPEAAALVLIERGHDALAEVQSLEQAQAIFAQTKILEAASRAVKLTKETITAASELHVRAERRVGQILADTPKAEGRRGQGRPPKTPAKKAITTHDRLTPTLEEQGITPNESARAQNLAKLPEEKFEGAIEQAKAEGAVTAATVLRKADPKLAEVRARAGISNEPLSIHPLDQHACPSCGRWTPAWVLGRAAQPDGAIWAASKNIGKPPRKHKP